MKTTGVKGNSSIPIFDTKPIKLEINCSTSSDQNLYQPSSTTSRLPSFQHKPNRQRLSLTTRKCLSSNVTPISSPIIPRSINNNYNPPVHEFSKEVIDSSAKLINDIDVTLSQLSKQYYSDNNNLFESNTQKSINVDNDTSPTTLQNNNGVSHNSNITNELCDCKTMDKLKLKKINYPVKCTNETNIYNSLPKTSLKQGHSNTCTAEPVMSRPTKLPVNRNQDFGLHSNNEHDARKTSKYSGRRYKPSVANSKTQEDSSNSNTTYTEAWVYNSATNDLLNYMSNATNDPRRIPQSGLPVYQTNGLQKSIFMQHRLNRNDTSKSIKYSPKIPLSNRKWKNNNEESITNRDSGIYLSCPKDTSIEYNPEPKINNNHIIQTTLPQPPPRISSLVSVSYSSMSRCPTLTNHGISNPKEYLYHSNKNDRRKARELFASVKQRDEHKNTLDNEKGTDAKIILNMKNDEIKCQVVETPNSDLEAAVVEGYSSDMDNLKNSGYLSDNSGYMSEGGLGLYAHKMQQRFREGLLAVEESLKTTAHNKIIANRVGSLEKDDMSSTSSDEIEDYLRELSSRLECPSSFQDGKSGTEIGNSKLIKTTPGFQSELKNKMYQERLDKYVCDVEPAADFDITSSCSMDLLTGKALSGEDAIDYKGILRSDVRNMKLTSNIYDYCKYSGRKSSMDSCLGSRQMPAACKSRPTIPEILEAAGPTAAIFEEVNPLKVTIGDNVHYRAMSLPGRTRSNTGWHGEGMSLCRGDTDYVYTLPEQPPQPPQQSSNNVYYEVPVSRNRAARTSGSSTPSLMNIRLPYATVNQGVRNSNSTTSLGKRDSDCEDVYDGLGSHLSLLSTGSYRSLNEERQATEIRKLRRELELAQSKVRTLSGQLSNNGTLVTAFEGTLQSMSLRLQKFAANSESKESELNELKNTIESLKKHAGSSPVPGEQSSPKIYSSSSLTNLSSNSNSNEKRSDGSMKKSSWFKASLGRAFRKKSSKDEGSSESINNISNNKDGVQRPQSNAPSITESESLLAMRKELEEKDARLTDVQLDALSRSHQLEQLRDQLTKMRYEMSSLKADNTRLQCLMTTSNGAMSIQSLDQSISGGNDSLDNEDDHTSTLKSTSKFKDLNARPKFDFLNALVKEIECAQPLMVYLAMKNITKTLSSNMLPMTDDTTTIAIGRIGINSMTSWSDLENSIRRLLKEYVCAIDPVSNLGLNGESIARYKINTDPFIHLCNSSGMRPLTSPLAACQNIVDSRIYLELKNHCNANSIDDMVFEFLIPKPILLRYFGLLLDHRRIILSGPSGTGKSYLANKLACNLASRYNRDPSTSILVFNLDKKSTKELRNYMTTLTEQLLKTDPNSELCLSSSATCLPLVIILDNLHHVSSFSEIFNSFLSIHHSRSPFVIGTMNQMNSMASNNLQLHHNFRWVLCTNHMEPVKGFLGRYLRRQFLKHQMESKQSLDQLFHVIEWIAIVWQHINKFLETYSSPDVTIGPRLFLNCPMSIEKSKAWFIDLWNYSLVPYVLDAVRDGLNTHGRKQATWDDPTDWIIRSWPWSDLYNSLPVTNSAFDTTNLIRLRSEDVGFDSYQLITTTSAHIGPYSVSANLGVDSLNMSSSGWHYSGMVDRRSSRLADKSDTNDTIMSMSSRGQDKKARNKK